MSPMVHSVRAILEGRGIEDKQVRNIVEVVRLHVMATENKY